MNKKWEYMGRCYPLNIMCESCFLSVSRGIAELSHALRCGTIGSASLCDVIRVFFDSLFGDGEGTAICGEGDNAEKHISAYISFIGFLCAEIDAYSRMREELAARV
ncbi:MAG: hypothetical protein E7628_03420 [Ruminococcaceae bacterium]|nr:hypothetical protein [Oscillospiraceae bacterium]